MIKRMVEESKDIIIQREYMKDFGVIIYEMEKAFKFIQMGMYMMAIILTVDQMDLEFLNGRAVKYMMDNGEMG